MNSAVAAFKNVNSPWVTFHSYYEGDFLAGIYKFVHPLDRPAHCNKFGFFIV